MDRLNNGLSRMRAFALSFFSAVCFLVMPAHATLYKCQDVAGQITYTNLPCDKTGLKETKIIPPAPPPAEPFAGMPPTKRTVEPSEAVSEKKQVAKPEMKPSSTSLQLIKSQEASEKKCAKLNDALGKTMDEMDTARRQGYTAKQEAEWNARLKKLQADKNKLGCF